MKAVKPQWKILDRGADPIYGPLVKLPNGRTQHLNRSFQFTPNELVELAKIIRLDRASDKFSTYANALGSALCLFISQKARPADREALEGTPARAGAIAKAATALHAKLTGLRQTDINWLDTVRRAIFAYEQKNPTSLGKTDAQSSETSYPPDGHPREVGATTQIGNGRYSEPWLRDLTIELNFLARIADTLGKVPNKKRRGRRPDELRLMLAQAIIRAFKVLKKRPSNWQGGALQRTLALCLRAAGENVEGKDAESKDMRPLIASAIDSMKFDTP